MNLDVINATFELCGALMMAVTLYRAWQLRIVQGVHLATPLFFWGWGTWNVFYYPHLEQFWSFSAGVLLLIANTAWIYTVFALTPKSNRLH